METRQKQISNVLRQKMKVDSSEEINDGLFKHVDIKNNRYSLRFSEKECLRMGISPLEYRRVIVDLGKINRLIAESEKHGGQRINLDSSRKMLFSNKISGFFKVSDMQAVKEKIFIPAGYKKVRFHSCVPKSLPYTIITCGVSVQSGAFTLDSLHATKFWVRSTEIALKSSNCNGELYLQIGDQYGGFGSWELIK